MELNLETKTALQQLGEESFIADSLFKKMVQIALEHITNDKNLEMKEYKTQFSALLYLFYEAAKHDYNSLELTTNIEDDIGSQERTQFICESFESSKDSIRKKLETKGFEFPSLIDIDW
eukprot:gene7974-12439_t